MDAYSKWPEVVELRSATAAKTIEVLRQLFARYGLPEQVVSDNGSQFTSEEFEEFMKRNGIKHTFSAPYHPATNGLVERFVQTFKKAMKAGCTDGKTLQHQLASFLLSYRTSPHTTTNMEPCTLFLRRHVRTRLDLIKPDLAAAKQAAQKKAHDGGRKGRELVVGESVIARNYSDGEKWLSGTIAEKLGPLSYSVKMDNGLLWRRHIDQLLEVSKPCGAQTEPRVPTTSKSFIPEHSPPAVSAIPEEPTDVTPTVPEVVEPPEPVEETSESHGNTENKQETQTASPPARRYPTRIRKCPDRYSKYLRTFYLKRRGV